jgi:xylan 1,4-beta-xylosidase
MFGMMSGTRVEARSNSGISWENVIESGVRGDKPDIGSIASVKKDEAAVMIWNYHDDDKSAPDADVDIKLNGIQAKNVKIIQYRIDRESSNSYEVWKKMGSPMNPTSEQYSVLEKAGQLEQKGILVSKKVKKGSLVINTAIPRQGVELLVIRWK